MQIVIKGPLHGYALTAAIEEQFGWKPSQTSIYNALRSLEKEGHVSAEERIEQGRVQKVYSITKQGQAFVEQLQKKMKKRMANNISKMLSFWQMVESIEGSEESQAFQMKIEKAVNDLQGISCVIFTLLEKAPDETMAVIDEAIVSLEKIAAKYNVEFDTVEMTD